MPHLPHHVRWPVYGVVGTALREDNVWKHTTSEKQKTHRCKEGAIIDIHVNLKIHSYW